MGMGMNTQAIFHPGVSLGRELRETSLTGLTRIEISYYADSVDAEMEFWDPLFYERACRDTVEVHSALSVIENVGFTVPILHLLQAF